MNRKQINVGDPGRMDLRKTVGREQLELSNSDSSAGPATELPPSRVRTGILWDGEWIGNPQQITGDMVAWIMSRLDESTLNSVNPNHIRYVIGATLSVFAQITQQELNGDS